MPIPKSIFIPTAVLAIGTLGFVTGRITSSSPAAGASLHLASLPPVPAVQAPIRRFVLTAKPPLAETVDLIAATLRSGGFRMSKRWEIIINTLEPADLPRLMAILAQHQASGAHAALQHALFARWAEIAPEAALQHAQSFTSKVDRDRAMVSVFAGWAYTDPVALATWARHLPSGNERDAAMRAVLQHAADLAVALGV